MSGGKYQLQQLLMLSGLALFSASTQADTADAASAVTLAPVVVAAPEYSFWVDAAPMTLVIDQLASLAGKTAEIEGLAEMPVSGRFSGSLDSVLGDLADQYPVAFDVEGEVLRAIDGSALTSVSIAMLDTELDSALKSELQVAGAGSNKLEFREDAVRISGHPAFVKRTAGVVTKALIKARGSILVTAPESEAEEIIAGDSSDAADATSIADAGSVEVLVDIEDEGRAPADQASLSKPIRWVTDIPGYNTF